jgi:uncharacterized protein (DUF2141 family)
LLLLPANASPPGGSVDLHIQGLRSQKGILRACLTREPKFFPHCEKDAASYKLNVTASAAGELHFTGVAPGDYAITVLHDENSNAKPDFLFGIPKEGVGFSRNPVLKFGPPSFTETRFHVADGPVVETIKLKYFL